MVSVVHPPLSILVLVAAVDCYGTANSTIFEAVAGNSSLYVGSALDFIGDKLNCVTDMSLVRRCADLSYAAYFSAKSFATNPTINNLLDGVVSSYPSYIWLSTNSAVSAPTAQIWPYEDGTVFVVFKGTSTIQDIKRDIQWNMRSTIWGHIHVGFLKVYQKIENALLVQLKSLQGIMQRVVVTGHSLGAALATIAVLSIKSKLPHIGVDLVTFASPKVGDTTFAINTSLFAESLARVADADDKIPDMPSRKEYAHVAGCTITLQRVTRKATLPHTVRCHRIMSYIEKLRNMLSVPQ